MKSAMLCVGGVVATSRDKTTQAQFMSESKGKKFFLDMYASW